MIVSSRFVWAVEGGSFMLVLFWVWGEPVLGLPLINGRLFLLVTSISSISILLVGLNLFFG